MAELPEVLPAKQALPVWQLLAREQAQSGPVEFCGSPLLKTRCVQVPAGKSQEMEVKYAQPLTKMAGRCDYVLPRSESVQNTIPWTIRLNVQAEHPISTVYSPSHQLKSQRLSANSFQVLVDEKAAAQPGAFWLSYLRDQGELSATLFTKPDESTPEADGTFLFLAGLPAQTAKGQTIPRELILALDRSGSMQGKKISQVREAAVEVLEGLNNGESFNIITYNDGVNSFAKTPVQKTPKSLEAAIEFIEDVRPRGGTNLHEALLESVRQKPTPRTLPIVLFLTDGLPTVGETAEMKIQEVIAKQNPYHRRVFTVGVGVDVNTPLLETIATETAQPTFVLPTENIKTKVTQVFQSLKQPILADAKLEIINTNGEPALNRIGDVFPNPLPDLFKDDHLVVLGQYKGEDPLMFRVKGNYLGTEKTFEFTFPIKDQPAFAFVDRLWATRKIADLVQDIRKSAPTPILM